MSKRLKDNLSSDWFSAANSLRSKKARRRIVAYVESYDDVFFWRTVLGDFEDETRYFEVMLPSKVNLSKGKKQVLMNFIGEHVGEDMIACVDADYDYLLQGSTALSRKVLESPYVFHTYVYAIENCQCYAPSLHEVCVMATLNDRSIFDFETYLLLYSKAIFSLFVWSIWYHRYPGNGSFNIAEFNKVVVPGHFTIKAAPELIAKVKRKANRKVMELQQDNPDAKETYLALKEEMKSLGVTPENTYLYVQGHHLFETVVQPAVQKVCDTLRREREVEIRSKAIHATQMQNELSCYQHSIESSLAMLRKNTGFQRSPQYKQLQRDIQHYLDQMKTPASAATVTEQKQEPQQ